LVPHLLGNHRVLNLDPPADHNGGEDGVNRGHQRQAERHRHGEEFRRCDGMGRMAHEAIRAATNEWANR